MKKNIRNSVNFTFEMQRYVYERVRTGIISKDKKIKKKG